MKFISPKWLCTLGFGLFGLASFSSGVLNPDFAGPQFNQIQIVRALGQPLIMVTISLIATAYILPQDAGSASSLFNILRNLGGAIGIALLATLLDARTKTYFDYLRESISPANPQVAERMASAHRPVGQRDGGAGQAQRNRPPAGGDHGLQRCVSFCRDRAGDQHGGGVADQEAAAGHQGWRGALRFFPVEALPAIAVCLQLMC